MLHSVEKEDISLGMNQNEITPLLETLLSELKNSQRISINFREDSFWSNITAEAGVYIIRETNADEILYVGQTVNFFKRMKQVVSAKDRHAKAKTRSRKKGKIPYYELIKLMYDNPNTYSISLLEVKLGRLELEEHIICGHELIYNY